jgi:quercetin dioxygenase-like cupin family protein
MHIPLFMYWKALLQCRSKVEKKTLTVGELLYETPDDIHSVSVNASDTGPAKILVFFLKKKGAPASEPAP